MGSLSSRCTLEVHLQCYLTSALSCQGLVNKDLSQKISIINSLKWSTSTRFYAFST